MGDAFNTSSGGSSAKVVTTPGQPQGEMNDILASQIKGSIANTGGIPAFSTPQPSLFNLSAPEEAIRQQLLSFSTNPQALTGNAQGLMAGPLAPYFNLSPGEEAARQGGMNFAANAPGFDYSSFLTSLSGLGQQSNQLGKLQAPTMGNFDPMSATQFGATPQYSTARLNEIANPQAQLAAAQGAYNQFAMPQIRNSLTASGQGRSGAEAELLSQTSMANLLPILQQSQALQFGGEQAAQAANQQAQMGAQGANQQAGLLAGQQNLGARLQSLGANLGSQLSTNAQNEGSRIAGLNQQYQGAFATPAAGQAADQQAFQRLSALQGLAAQPRQLQLQGFSGMGLPLAQQGISDLQQAMTYAGLPRAAALDDYNRLQALTLGVVGRTPFDPGTSATQNIEKRKNLFTDVALPALGAGLYAYGQGGFGNTT